MLAIISDVHANEEALRAVLEDAFKQGVTEIACLGDIVGYNSSPAQLFASCKKPGSNVSLAITT